MQQFGCQFDVQTTTRILDVGGGETNWRLLDVVPDLVFLNLSAPKTAHRWVIADGCNLPFASKSFDIVYSNSVIEHLSLHERQQRFAEECRRVGIRLSIQTPNKWFFIEPHLITPLIHWLPRDWQRRLLRNFTVWGLITRPTQEQRDAFLNEVRLLTSTEMQELFPDATIQRERFLGLTKSLIAVR